jgi:hypothetical protein
VTLPFQFSREVVLWQRTTAKKAWIRVPEQNDDYSLPEEA